MIFAGQAEVAPGKPQTGRVKLKITGGAKFSLVEGKKSDTSSITGPVILQGVFRESLLPCVIGKNKPHPGQSASTLSLVQSLVTKRM